MSMSFPSHKQVRALVRLSQRNRQRMEQMKRQLYQRCRILEEELYNVDIPDLQRPPGFRVSGHMGPRGFEGNIEHDVEHEVDALYTTTEFFYRYGRCVNRKVNGRLIYKLDTPELRPCEYIERFIELVGQRGKDRPDLLASIESTSQQISKLNGELYYDRYH